MTAPLSTPRRSFLAAGSASLASTAPLQLGPGGCPYEATMPKWLLKKDETSGPIIPQVLPPVIFVLGAPGSGKRTQCKKIKEEFHYEHLSMGELLLQERSKPDSDVGSIINEHISQGALVPADVTVEVLKRAMDKVPDWKHTKFLIDGFPRNVEQALAFNEVVGSRVIVSACMFFDCSEANQEKRLRAQAGAEADDDAITLILNRIANFRNDGAVVKEYFQHEGLLERIDANREVSKVWHDVQRYYVAKDYHDQISGPSAGQSATKAIWKLRDKQSEEMFPTGRSHTSTATTKGEHARIFNSYLILKKHKDKHTRNMQAPQDSFLEPMTMAQEVGWHQADDGEHIGAKGTPRGINTPRAFYPKNTCSMTRHLENMYSSNAVHIIRRW